MHFYKSKLLTTILIVFILLCGAAQSAVAVTRYVKKDSPSPDAQGLTWNTAFRTINAALSAAASGDEIWVAAGTYYERLTIRANSLGINAISFYGGFAGTETARDQRDWRNNETIIDGQGGGIVVYIESLPAGALDGFTIRNGNNSSYAGGIYCYSSNISIRNNTITGNVGYTGGITVYLGSPTVSNNTITGNSTTINGCGGGISCENNTTAIVSNNVISGNTATQGGGIYCFQASPTIQNNTISANVVEKYGGGIYCRSSASVISNNTISENRSTGYNSGNGGGGIYCTSSSPTIINNIIRDNTVRDYGGGIQIYQATGVTISNNTFSGNIADSVGGGIYCVRDSSATINNNTFIGNSGFIGSGICCELNTTATITNNTIVGNTASVSTGGSIAFSQASGTVSNNIVCYNSFGISKLNSGTVTLSKNCVFGNTNGNFSEVTATTDIQVDPLFVDRTNGNLRLQAGSPCIDTGNSTAPGMGTTDRDGNNRVFGGHIDIGAYEFHDLTVTLSTTKASTNSSPITVTVTFNYAVTGFGLDDLQIGNGSASNLSGSGTTYTVDVTPTAEGPVMVDLAVGVVELDGSMNLAAATLSIVYDTTPPDNPSVPDLLDSSDTGTSNTDNRTADNTPTFSGTAEAGATVKLYAGLTEIGSATANDGSWSITSDSLADGAYTIIARATDAAGNPGPSSAGLTVTIDTTAPKAAVTYSNSIVEQGDSLTITADFDEVLADVPTVQIAMSGANTLAFTNMVKVTPTRYSYTYIVGPGDGLATVSFGTGTDAAGNVVAATPTSGATVIVDNSVPTAAVTYSKNRVKQGDSLIITADFSEALAELPVVQLAIAGTNTLAFTDMSQVTSTQYTYTYTVGGGDGAATVSFGTGTDLAGNVVTSTPASGATFTVDNTAPAVTSIKRQSPSGSTTGSSSVTYRVTFNESVNGVDSSDFTVIATGGASGVITALSAVGSAVYDITVAVNPTGTLRLDLKTSGTGITDDAGNPINGGYTAGETYDIRKVWYVKADAPAGGSGSAWNTAFQTVTAAINAAASGDQIWVSSGTYYERITLKNGVAIYGGFDGAETALGQRDWQRNITILDGQNGGSVVTSSSHSSTLTRIDGFTIRNGSGTLQYGVPYGGGIYCRDSKLTISNNTIIGNTANDGGGLYCEGQLTISNNTISGNSASYVGAGISYRGNPIIINNIISGNVVDNRGSAIYAGYNSSATISDNLISNNRGVLGGGIYLDQAAATLVNNNTFYGSVSTYSGSLDGSIILYECSPIISNNIFAFNTRGIYSTRSNPTISNNCFYGNTNGNYSPEILAGEGDMDVDPEFVDVNKGNFRLKTGSPCIDAGDDSTVGSGTMDLDGVSRIINSHVDIGAYEWHLTADISTTAGIATKIQPIPMTITFNNPVTGFDLSDLVVTNGNPDNFRGSGAIYEVDIIPDVQGKVTISIPDGVAQDGAGNLNLAVPILRVIYDTTPPASPSTPDLADSSDLGASNTDNLTADTTPTFTGTAEPGSTVRLYSGVTEIGAAVADDGNWSITSTALTGGTYNITAQATDAAGNTGAVSGGLTVIIDDTAPTAEVTYSSNIVKAGDSLMITAAFSKVLSDAPVIRIAVSGANTVDFTDMSKVDSTHYTYTYTVGVGDGPATVSFGTGTDMAGNVITATPISGVGFTVDNTAPTATVTYAKNIVKAGDLQTITATFDEEVTESSLVQITINGAATIVDAMTRVDSTHYTYTYTVGVGDGPATVSLGTGTDAAGNIITTMPTSGATFTVDNTAPTVTISGPSRPVTKNSNVTYTITYTGADNITLASGDIILHTTGTAEGTVAVGGTGNETREITISGIAGNGTLGISLAAGTATDNAGNTAAGAGPSITCTVDNIAPSGYGVTINQSKINNLNPNLSFTLDGAEPGSTCNYTIFMSYYEWQKVTGAGIVSNANQEITGIDVSGLSNGPLTLSITLTDAAGNTGEPIVAMVNKTTVRLVKKDSPSPDGKGLTWDTAFHSVGEAITGAYMGNEIWVAAGTYNELIQISSCTLYLYGGFSGTETVLEQRDWQTHKTILDGSGKNGSVVTVGIDITRIDGFTIQNGSGSDNGYGYLQGGGILINFASSVTISNNTITGSTAMGGGGIFCYYSSGTISNNTISGNTAMSGGGINCFVSSPTISNNTISGNTASFGGGGIYSYQSTSNISNNTITENTAGGGDDSGGGGIYSDVSSLVISNNTISQNTANCSGRSGGGGGIYCKYASPVINNNNISMNTASGIDTRSGGGGIFCISSSATISNNTITGNTASNAAEGSIGGGGIYCLGYNDTTLVIKNNTLSGNTAGGSYGIGGGIYCAGYYFSPTISNNTITNNTAINYSGRGGGIYCDTYDPATISNNIIAFNSQGLYSTYQTSTVFNNCVYGNSNGDYLGVPALDGDIQADPRFVDSENGNFRLQSDSPCINAGNDSGIDLVGPVDLDGNRRMFGGRIDIGAYEFHELLVVLSTPAGEATNSSPIPVTVTFNFVVTGFDEGELEIGNGRVIGFAGSGTTYSAEIWPDEDGEVTVDVAGGVVELDGSQNTAATTLILTYDSVLPAVSIGTTAEDPTNLSPIPVTITFKEPVTGFEVGDIEVVNGTAGNFGGSGMAYSLEITPDTQGTVIIRIPEGAGVDAAGNGNLAVQLGLKFDSAAPTGSVVINDGSGIAENTVVTLTLFGDGTGSDLVQMRFSNDGTVWSAWEAYTTIKSWILGEPDAGTSNVFVQLRDTAGNTGTLSGSVMLRVQSPVLNAPTVTANTPFRITMTCPADDAVIRYTTDGSEPTETSAVYESPILISKTGTVTARAFKENWFPSEPAVAAYTIGSVTKIYQPVSSDPQSPDLLQTAQNFRNNPSVQYNSATLWLGKGNTGNFSDIWLRFPYLIGPNEGQIPVDARIVSARLVLTLQETVGNQNQSLGFKLYQITDPDSKRAPVFGDSGVRNGLDFLFRDHRLGMNIPWQNGADDITALFTGVDPIDTYEFIPSVFATVGYSEIKLDVTGSIVDWLSGDPVKANQGWYLTSDQTLNWGYNDGLVFYGAGASLAARRPRLEITYVSADVDNMPPAAVTDLSATPGDQYVQLNWINPVLDFNGVIVVRKEGIIPAYPADGTTIYDGTAGNYFDEQGLNNGKTYYYAVFAYDELRNYSRKTWVKAIPGTVFGTAPSAPTGLTVSLTGSTLNFVWTDNSADEDLFVIEQQEADGEWKPVASPGVDETGITLQRDYPNVILKPLTNYQYRIKAVNAFGSSVYTMNAGGITTPDFPAAPSGLSWQIISAGRVNLSWTDNAINETGYRIDVCRNDVERTVVRSINLPANASSVSITGLVAGTEYLFKIVAINGSEETAIWTDVIITATDPKGGVL